MNLKNLIKVLEQIPEKNQEVDMNINAVYYDSVAGEDTILRVIDAVYYPKDRVLTLEVEEPIIGA